MGNRLNARIAAPSNGPHTPPLATSSAIPPYAQLSAIFTDAPFGLAIADARGCLRYYNPALQALLGYGDDELRGLQPCGLSHPDELTSSLAVIAEVRAGQR